MSFYLQISGGPKQSFTDLNLRALKCLSASQGAGRFMFEANGAAMDSAPMAVEGTICTVYNGATSIFSGRIHKIPRKGDGKDESVSYELRDAWYDFEQNVFQQGWNVLTLDNMGNPVITEEYRSRCILGMTIGGIAESAAGTISEIVTWAIGVGANCQLGTIGINTYVALAGGSIPTLPYNEILDLPCSKAIQKVLEYCPDAVTWFDYSTSPPTFNVTRRYNLPVVNLPFVNTAATEAIEIAAIPDTSRPSVVIRYEQTNKITSDGNTVASTVIIPDIYPSGATGTEYGALVQTVELPGGNAAYQTQSLQVTAIPQASTDAGAMAFFYDRSDALNGRTNDSTHAYSLDRLSFVDGEFYTQVAAGQVDSGGNPVSTDPTDFPNAILWGTVSDWMNETAANIIVSGGITYAYPDSATPGSEDFNEVNSAILYFGGATMDQATGIITTNGDNNDNIITITVKATSGVTKTYQQLSNYTQPEPVPIGIAQLLYENLNPVQYEGTYRIVSQECPPVNMGVAVNIVGSNQSAWATMQAPVQEIEFDYDGGMTTLHFGPPAHIDFNTLMAQLRGNRNRTTSERIEERQTGTPSAPNVDGPGHAPAYQTSDVGLGGISVVVTGSFNGQASSGTALFAVSPTAI